MSDPTPNATAQIEALALLDRMLAAQEHSERWGPGLRYALGIIASVDYALRHGDDLATIAARAGFRVEAVSADDEVEGWATIQFVRSGGAA